MNQKFFKEILLSRVYDVALETPLDYAPNLSDKLKNHIGIKREDLQPVFSFKIRGAYNKIAQLPPSERSKGIIAASAGNHAQGVAYAAGKLQCSSTIVMPENTIQIKVDAVKKLGAHVIIHGETYDDAAQYALKLANKKGCPFIHPYDDPLVIAGQGTIGMEILKQCKKTEMIFVPIGGGGLISGIASYVKFLNPQIKIIGVEPVDAASMYHSLKKNKRVTLKSVNTFADGVAIKKVGRLTFGLCRKLVDDIILVTTDEICAAIKDVFEDTRSVLEPSGALSIAGLVHYVRQKNLKNHTLIAIASGANINFHRLRHVSERAELGENREAILAMTLPERPGSFREFMVHLGERKITEFNYRRGYSHKAHVFLGLQIQDKNEMRELTDKLQKKGYQILNLSDDEMAKLHLRYTVGGKPPVALNEYFYRFEFPESPGALSRFINHLSDYGSMSLFHYRNHGADTGRVLVGIEMAQNNKKKFQLALNQLGYKFWDESQNPACALFLYDRPL